MLGALVVGVMILATAGLGEIAMRVISRYHLIYNIEMVKYAKALKMRDPRGEVSHVHVPSAAAHLMGVDVALNSLGDRGPELQPKSPSLKRVLVLGSSITLGWGVPYDSVFTTRTEARLNQERPFGPDLKFEFINAGIGNYNSLFQYRLFLRQFPVVNPDLVVLNYFISDVQPRTMGRDNAILKYSLLSAFLFDRWSQLKLRLSPSYTDLFTFYKNLYADSSSAWKNTRQEVLAMHDSATSHGIPFVVLITPDIHDLSPGTPYEALYRKMDSTFTSMGLATVSSFGRFQQQFGSDVSRLWIQSDDPHPNSRGHALTSDILYQYLVDTDPLKLRPPADGSRGR